MGTALLTHPDLALTRRTKGDQGEQENAGGGENHGGGGELDCSLLSAAYEACSAYLSQWRSRPRDGPPRPCPASSHRVNRQHWPPCSRPHPVCLNRDLAGKLSHRGPVQGSVGWGDRWDHSLAFSFTYFLIYIKSGAQLGTKRSPWRPLSTHTWGNKVKSG